jgi:O-antigen/teichoic acid export membrane protein
MLFRQTILYLPAQLLPALCQFAQLIAWSHLASPRVIGIVTLFTSIQEFLNIAFMGFWQQYTQRFATKHSQSDEDALRFRHASTIMVGASLAVQGAIGLAIYYFAIDRSISPLMVLVLVALVAGRALNLYQGTQFRAIGDIMGYSIANMSGPVLGLLLGLVLLWWLGDDPLWVFLGFALAQAAGVMIGLARDRSWIGVGRPDLHLMRTALAYGGPLIVSSILAWVTQNASRIAISYILGLAAAGIYSVGMGLGYRASMVAAMMVTAAAFPLAVRLANDGDMDGARRQLAANGALLFGALAASLGGLALVGHDVVHLLVAEPLRAPVYPVMLWSMLAGAMICIRQHYLNQFSLMSGRTRPIATVALVEAPVAILLALVIVPRYGPVGGAVALAVTSALSMTATVFVARQSGLIVPWRDGAKITVATLAMAAGVLAVPPASNLTGLAFRILAGGLAFVAAIAFQYRHWLAALVARRKGRA